MLKDDLPEEYAFIEEEEKKIDRYTAKIFWIWGITAVILVAISVGIELFWPLPK